VIDAALRSTPSTERLIGMRLRSAAGAEPVIRRVLAGWRRDSSINAPRFQDHVAGTLDRSFICSKPWLSFANHKRIPHDPRAMDSSAPNRDVDVTTYLDRRVKALFG
jgi:hypothetical protein